VLQFPLAFTQQVSSAQALCHHGLLTGAHLWSADQHGSVSQMSDGH
jgi:hypothetical protein